MNLSSNNSLHRANISLAMTFTYIIGMSKSGLLPMVNAV